MSNIVSVEIEDLGNFEQKQVEKLERYYLQLHQQKVENTQKAGV